jgi:stringent starvation protein B
MPAMLIDRMIQGPTATKRSVLEQLLDQGMVLVALDARVDGVDVPSHLAGDPQLRLNLSYRFGLPMSVESWGVRATLTFAGVPFTCRFPWAAIFLVVSHVSGQPYLFPDDIPAELLNEAPEMAATLGPPTTGKRPKLTLIRSDSSKNAPESEPGEPARPVGRRRSPAKATVASIDAKEGASGAAERPPKRRPAAAKAVKPVPSPAPAEAAKAAEDSPPPSPADSPASSPRRRGHLRLVK